MHFVFTKILIFTLFISNCLAKVDPPNYNFSLDALEIFNPGKNLNDIQKKYGKGELIEATGDLKTYKFYVAQIRYKFPVYVQVFKGISLDFFARLPTYFSHDLFHQSIINRIGKQDKFFKVEANALYQWLNKNGNTYNYSGTCTITCFPLYFSTNTENPPIEVSGYNPMINKLSSIKTR